jgi:dienelactone hydrolase
MMKVSGPSRTGFHEPRLTLVPLMIGAISRAVDTAVLARLNFVEVHKPAVIDLRPVDAAAFWQESAVREPAPVNVVRQLDALDGSEWRELELTARSDGPGSHAGSRALVATAHVREAAPSHIPLILMLHGYAVPVTYYDRWLAWRMRRAGAHTVRMDLPFHLRRSIPGKASGEGFFSIDPGRMRAVVRQSVEDAAAIVAWARREVSPMVGVFGVSLGGLVATLLAAQVRLDSLVAVVPLCDPPASFTECPPGPMQRYLGMLGEGDGYWGVDAATARRNLDGALAPLVARNLVPATPPERVWLVRAEHDLIVGPGPVSALAQAWGAEMETYASGHVTVMNAPGIARNIRDRALRAAERVEPALRHAG